MMHGPIHTKSANLSLSLSLSLSLPRAPFIQTMLQKVTLTHPFPAVYMSCLSNTRYVEHLAPSAKFEAHIALNTVQNNVM